MQFPTEHASTMQPQCSRSAEAQPNMQIGTPCGRRSSRAMIHAAPFMGGWLARLPRRLFRDSRRPDSADSQNLTDSPHSKDSSGSND